MLERAIDWITLRGPELIEVGVDALASVELRRAVPSAQVPSDVLPCEHRLGDVVKQHGRNYTTRRGLGTSWPSA